jgi:hypothetical protein
MKKLLLLLFLSLSVIGSANANSIDGAFGYKLGQVEKGEIKNCKLDSPGWYKLSDSCASFSIFKPSKPLLDFKTYSYHTTYITDKIYKIWTRFYKWNASQSRSKTCPHSLDLTKLLGMLEAKYGDFEVSQYGIFKDSGVSYKFKDKARTIDLNCQSSIQLNGQYDIAIELFYTDLDLQKLDENEKDKVIKKRLLEESSDYDI